MTFELTERLAQRHPADAEALRERALRRQPVAGCELTALDRVLERNFNLRMRGAVPTLDGSFRQRHYGLDFSMPTEALVLALSAAVIHAVWNLLLAGARDSQAFAAVVLLVAAIVGAPAAVFFWDLHVAVWPFLAATSLLELTYFALLAYAYTRAELSVVYPLARGLAPVLVLAAAVAFTGAGTNGRCRSAACCSSARASCSCAASGEASGALLAVRHRVRDRVLHGRRQARRHARLACRLSRADEHLHRASRTRRSSSPRAARARSARKLGWKSVGAGIGTFAAYACVLVRAAARLGRLGRRGTGERRARRDRPRGDRPARAGDALAGGRRSARRCGIVVLARACRH